MQGRIRVNTLTSAITRDNKGKHDNECNNEWEWKGEWK